MVSAKLHVKELRHLWINTFPRGLELEVYHTISDLFYFFIIQFVFELT